MVWVYSNHLSRNFCILLGCFSLFCVRESSEQLIIPPALPVPLNYQTPQANDITPYNPFAVNPNAYRLMIPRALSDIDLDIIEPPRLYLPVRRPHHKDHSTHQHHATPTYGFRQYNWGVSDNPSANFNNGPYPVQGGSNFGVPKFGGGGFPFFPPNPQTGAPNFPGPANQRWPPFLGALPSNAASSSSVSPSESSQSSVSESSQTEKSNLSSQPSLQSSSNQKGDSSKHSESTKQRSSSSSSSSSDSSGSSTSSSSCKSASCVIDSMKEMHSPCDMKEKPCAKT